MEQAHKHDFPPSLGPEEEVQDSREAGIEVYNCVYPRGRLESTFRYSPGRPGWVPFFGRHWSWWPLFSRPSVGSPVAPDVDPERDDEHGCGGEVEDGAEDSFYAFVQGHGFPPPLSNLLGFGLAALP